MTAPPFPAILGSVPIDAAGRVRIQDARVAVGAYEEAFVNNDTCATAMPIVNGTTAIDSRPANPDGLVTNCGMSGNSPALWYAYTAPQGLGRRDFV